MYLFLYTDINAWGTALDQPSFPGWIPAHFSGGAAQGFLLLPGQPGVAVTVTAGAKRAHCSAAAARAAASASSLPPLPASLASRRSKAWKFNYI